MSTGLDSFTNPGGIGPLYPFPELAIPLVVVGIILWVLWHVKQTKQENRDCEEALDLYRRVGMERAMHFGGSSRVATDEDIEKVRAEPDVGAEPATTSMTRSEETGGVSPPQA